MKRKKIAKHVFWFRYPKLEFLILTILVAYFVFSQTSLPGKIAQLEGFGYIGVFIAGFFYSFGFSGPFAVGFFTSVGNLNIFWAALIGGVGSMISDMLIFTLIRFSFMNEFDQIKKTTPFVFIKKLAQKDINSKLRRIMLYIFSCAVIASPLPDEIGVTMLSGLTNITPRRMVIISLILSTAGIFFWLFIGGKFAW